MKKQVTVDVYICDICEKNDAGDYSVCLCCNKHICYECRQDKNKAVEYKHALHFSGSGDGLYCTSCDDRLALTQSCDLHTAYQNMAKLRRSEKMFYTGLKQEADKVEKQIERLYHKK